MREILAIVSIVCAVGSVFLPDKKKAESNGETVQTQKPQPASKADVPPAPKPKPAPKQEKKDDQESNL